METCVDPRTVGRATTRRRTRGTAENESEAKLRVAEKGNRKSNGPCRKIDAAAAAAAVVEKGTKEQNAKPRISGSWRAHGWMEKRAAFGPKLSVVIRGGEIQIAKHL